MLKRFRLLGWGSAPESESAVIAEAVSRDDSPNFERAFAERHEPVKPPEGFGGAPEVWIYLRPGSNEALLVDACELSSGTRLNLAQKKLLAKGKCLEVVSLTPVREYWRQPYEAALKKMPQFVGAEPSADPPMKKVARLASAGVASGIWLRVEVPAEETI
ncbi:hypothetical protein ACOTC5_29950 [Achromobacter xylosoxidans]